MKKPSKNGFRALFYPQTEEFGHFSVAGAVKRPDRSSLPACQQKFVSDAVGLLPFVSSIKEKTRKRDTRHALRSADLPSRRGQ